MPSEAYTAEVAAVHYGRDRKVGFVCSLYFHKEEFAFKYRVIFFHRPIGHVTADGTWCIVPRSGRVAASFGCRRAVAVVLDVKIVSVCRPLLRVTRSFEHHRGMYREFVDVGLGGNT